MFPNQPNASVPFGESHVVETPEQTTLQFAVAGIWSRFLALAIDFLIQAGVVVTLLIGLVIFGSFFGGLPAGGQWMLAVSIACVFLLHFGYFAVFEILWRGQTPGKRMVHLRVVKDSGRPLNIPEIIGRNLMRTVDQLPAFYTVGIISALMTAQNKRLGDLVVGAIVIREGSLKLMRPDWSAGPYASAPPISSRQLSAEDLALIEAFLSRRSELPADVRRRIAGEIMDRLRPQLEFGREGGQSTESLLEALARESRSSSRYD